MGLENSIELQTGDSEKLLFENNTFDAVIVSFGVRNFENLEKGLTDMFRVTKAGGTCMVLEFSNPKTPVIKQFYNFYNATILPLIGRLISKDTSAYRYLPESVKAFPAGEAFLKVFQKAGFCETKCIPLTFGICSVYVGKKL
jgi:demethylmenaquinone methyltransferase/2-methoxy-6-polyprenyl-1,4-benzoquinol methylase